MDIPKINELSKELANLISAGEVVERPASVVKELIENGLDAKASIIRVELINSGLKKIIVSDNGYGILKDQIPVAVKKHATSKIQNASDLFNIATLGFRGEALPSIISISKTKISSSTDGIGGYFYEYKASSLLSEGQLGMAKGTKVEVENLFFNTPARLKHLGTEQVELSHITTLINRLAIANPYVSFTLINNNKLIYQTDGSGNMEDLLAKTYGLSVAKNLILFENKNDLYKIKGYTTNNNVFRSNKNYINIIINNRIIRNINILYAVTDAYKSIIPVGKYSITVLEIECDPSLIDVNVHPTKLEIRFTDENDLKLLISKTIGLALHKQSLIYNATEIDFKKNKIELPSEDILNDSNLLKEEVTKNSTKNDSLSSLWEMFAEEDNDNDESFENDSNIDEEDNENYDEILVQEIDSKKEQQSFSFTDNGFKSLNYIGQFYKTYLLFEKEQDLYLIDQHAAMERCMYEKIKNSLLTPSNKSYELLIPIKIDLSVSELPLVLENTNSLNNLGIKFEQFGGTTILVREVPTWIPEKFIIEFVSDIINHLINNLKVNKGIMYESLAKKISCKKSIKANTYILKEEVTNLLNDLDKCQMPYTCPHGRPTLVKISTHEIEKMFKRVI